VLHIFHPPYVFRFCVICVLCRVVKIEKRLVEDTLKPLETTRRAYRLVGGVLVERTVGEILPAVTTNKENIQMVLDNLQKNMEAKQKETSDWKAKYNIKTQQEAQAMQRAQQQ